MRFRAVKEKRPSGEELMVIYEIHGKRPIRIAEVWGRGSANMEEIGNLFAASGEMLEVLEGVSEFLWDIRDEDLGQRIQSVITKAKGEGK